MKKIIGLILVSGIIQIFSSCDVKEKTILGIESRSILFENEKVKLESLENFVPEIEPIELNFKSNNLKSGFLVDFEKCKKITLKTNKVELYFWELATNQNSRLIAIKNGNSIFFAISSLFVKDDLKSFTLKNLSNEEYFELSLNNNNELLGYLENPKISFQNDIIQNLGSSVSLKSAEEPTCRETTDNFFDCFACAILEFTNDIGWAIMCGLEPQWCLTMATLHCSLFDMF
jgi:hypothetical protein